MSTRVLRNTNAAIDEMRDVIEFISRQGNLAHLENVTVNFEKDTVSGVANGLQSILKLHGHIKGEGPEYVLTRSGRALFGRLLVDLGAIASVNDHLDGRYELTDQISAGRNSVAFRGRHRVLRTPIVLKCIRPGASDDLVASLRTLSQVDNSYLVHPIDYLKIPYRTTVGTQVEIECIVFPFIQGQTLEAYLRSSPPLSPYFFEAFLRQVGSALASLEAVGAYHGDLHAENILVTKAMDDIEFRLIDVSFGIGAPSGRQYEPSDLEQLRQHLWRALTILQRTLVSISIRKHLGAQLYALVEKVLTADDLTFSHLLESLNDNPDYSAFERRRETFLRSRFKEPRALGLLRYEEITDPAAAVEMFEPYAELFEQLRAFGNNILYGPRGSGKSTYLASLAFFPDTARTVVDFRQVFGVLFSCRQGEFKQFSSDLIQFTATTVIRVKHVLLLRVIRRVVGALAAAVKHTRLRIPASVSPLYRFLESYLGDRSLGPFGGSEASPVENLHAILSRHEVREVSQLSQTEQDQTLSPERGSALTEKDLREFLEQVRRVFPELRNTQFYILFDDAGDPNIPPETQQIVNEIVRSVNPVYCVKLSAERFSYGLKDSGGKVLEEGHDFVSLDIARTFSLKSGIDPERARLQKYFHSIVGKRLAHWGFQSADIIDYINERFCSTEELVARLAESRRNAYYAGWEVVWQIADRTTRNLLELISEIFAAAKVTPQTTPDTVSPQIQHTAIKRVSEKRLKALSYLPGELTIMGETTSRGRQLYDFATGFGRVSSFYLRHRRPSSGTGQIRMDERLGIERNDANALSPDATTVLRELIRFGVLDDSRFGTARDDQLRKPIYIFNRIFCPAFGISYRRDAHLRLSRSKFELFLCQPLTFARSGTRFLSKLADSGAIGELDLFGTDRG